MPLPPTPTVSICMPTYNRCGMLREALASAFAQSLQDFEVIVSDNASTDETEAMVKSFGDDRVRYFRQSANIGTVPNINFTLRQTKGRYVAFLFDDDLMLPDNLAHKVGVLERERKVGLVHSRYHIIDESGRLVRASTNQGHGVERPSDAVEPGHVFLERALQGVCEVNPASAVFRHECLERLGILDEELLHCDDFEYWMRTAVHYDVAYLAEPLIIWRVHSQTHTNKYMVAGKTGTTVEGLRDELRAKHKIISLYKDIIPNWKVLDRQLDSQTEERVVFQADCMLDAGTSRSEVEAFLFYMGSTFPRLFRGSQFWKMVTKVRLGRRGIDALKRALNLSSKS